MRFASVLKTRRTRIDVHVYTTRCFVNVFHFCYWSANDYMIKTVLILFAAIMHSDELDSEQLRTIRDFVV